MCEENREEVAREVMRDIALCELTGARLHATLDGAPAEIDMEDGRHVLVLRGGGERLAELRYSVCLGAERRLLLGLPRAISTAAGPMAASPPTASTARRVMAALRVCTRLSAWM